MGRRGGSGDSSSYPSDDTDSNSSYDDSSDDEGSYESSDVSGDSDSGGYGEIGGYLSEIYSGLGSLYGGYGGNSYDSSDSSSGK